MIRLIFVILFIVTGGIAGDSYAMPKDKLTDSAALAKGGTDSSTQLMGRVNNDATLAINIISLTSEQRHWADNNELTVYISQSWYPYSFESPTGEMIGYHIDLLKLIEKNLNIKIRTVVYNDWLQSLENVKQEKIGSIMGASPTVERSKFFSFSPIYLYRSAEFFTTADNDDITAPSDLKNGRIAVLKGDVLEEYMTQKFPNAQLLRVTNEVDLNHAVLTKKVDAGVIVADSASSEFYGEFKTIEQFPTKSGEFSIATSRKQPLLAGIIAKGVASLTAQQRQNIFDQWLAAPTKYSLYSEPELVFLRKHPTLSLGAQLWPQVISNNKGQYTGTSGNIINEMQKMMGVDFSLIYDTQPNLLEAVKHGHIDMVLGTVDKETSHKHDILSQAYDLLDVYIYEKKNKSLVNTSDFKGKRLAVSKHILPYLGTKLAFFGATLVSSESDESSLNMLESNKVDGILSNERLISEAFKAQYSSLNHSILGNKFTIEFKFLSANKHVILQSILQKTLTYIQGNKPSQTIENHYTKGVNVITQRNPIPFVAEKDIVKGIAYDLLESSFSKSQLKINKYTIESENNIRKVFEEEHDIDVMVMVDKKDDEYFYSDELTTYLDVVVSRLDKNYHFESLNDLSDKSIVAWTGAHQELGEEYRRLFNVGNNAGNYQEISDQSKQIEMLVANKVDVIITDTTILAWHINQIDPLIASQLKIDYIIPKVIPRYAAFKDEVLRDKFNSKLKILKDSGDYQSIIRKYTHGSVRSQVKLSQLVSNLIAKSIYEKDDVIKNKLLNTLSSLEIIDEININVLNEKSIKAGQHTSQSQQQSTRIVYFQEGKTIDVGELIIWFSPHKLSKAVSLRQDIPKLSKFKHMKDYRYFQSVYRRLGYTKKKLKFTVEEASYLASTPEINYTDANWQPLIFNQDNVNQGVVVDYLHLISRKTGLRFKYVPATSWAMAKQLFLDGKADILPAIGNDENTVGLKSKQYAKFHFAIVKRQDGSFADNLQDLESDKVVVLKGFVPASLIKNQFPQIDLTEVSTINEALTLLSEGQVNAFVGHAAVAWHYLVNDFSHLKVVGMTEDNYRHHILVQQDNPILLSIINKAINDIEYDESAIIRNKWVDKQQSLHTDYTLIIQIVSAFSFVLLLGYFFARKLMMNNRLIEKSNRRLSSTIEDLTSMQQTLTVKTNALQEQKDNFESLFNDATLGALLIQSNRIVDCNNALIEQLGRDEKNDLLLLSFDDISPPLQPSGVNSSQEIIRYFELCFEEGTVSFEWVVLKKDKSHLWCNVVLTKMSMNNTDVIHGVISDISDRKLLEQEILTHNLALQSTNKELEKSLSDLSKAQSHLIETEKLASLGELVAGVAHEINTPVGIGLTGISHFSHITESINSKYDNKTMSKSDFEKYLEQSTSVAQLVHKNLERTAELVSSFKKVSVDQTSEKKRQFEMNEYVNEILISLSNILKNTKIDIKLNCPPSLEIYSYPGAFSQILSNLIINSNIHGFPNQEAGIIDISIELTVKTLTIVYRDNGKGISKKSLPKIFDPFYTTNRENGGSGLGLNIIYNIITNQLAGTIQCESEPSHGVEFTISYPVELVD